MRTVPFKSVLYAIAYQIGLDPETNLNANEAASITEYINQAVRMTVESKDFPELTNVEQRTPASGLVAYNQSGQTPIGIVYQVYYQNPFAQRFPRERYFALSNQGVQLSPDAPSTVWVRFGLQPPLFTACEWVSGQTYAAGALVYDTMAGDCYTNLTGSNTGTIPSEDGTNWAKVQMPYIVAEAVKALVYQLVQREEGQTEKAEVEQKRGLTLLQAAQMQQAGKIPIAAQRRVYDGAMSQTTNAQGGV